MLVKRPSWLDMPKETILRARDRAMAAYTDYVGPGGLVASVAVAEALLAQVVTYERLLARASRPGRG
jgi:hypothetical protein